jgi:hypothetical protein
MPSPLSLPIRRCAGCGTRVDASNGFVKAGDVSLKVSPPRELCGRCVLIFQWQPDGTLIPFACLDPDA